MCCKRTLLAVCLSVLLLNLQSQETFHEIVKSVEPIEPTATAMAKYGSYPVNYSTGLPNIEIPLYTVKSGSLGFDIKLTYHGGGIKVSEEASWVGLGWNLNYGAQITRQVNGQPDELENYFNQPTESSIQQYIDADIYNLSSVYLEELAKDDPHSYMPDVYQYTLLGGSGTFILDSNNQPFQIPFGNAKIDFDKTSQSHAITTANGIQFSFNETDETTQRPPTKISLTYPGTWHVDKITSANKQDTISYTYQYDGWITQKTPSYSGGMSLGSTVCGIDDAIYHTFSSIPEKTDASFVDVESVKPQHINFKNGRISFKLSDRGDIYDRYSTWQENGSYNYQSVKKLEEIYVEQLNSDGTYDTIKKVVFNYDYFNASGPECHEAISPNCKKLKLTSVGIYNRKTNSVAFTLGQFYKFDYYEEYSIPHKLSFSQDYWGYYNGQNNSTLIPTTYLNFGNYHDFCGGANRSVNGEYAKTASLKTITYPTGGKTTFNWEVNRYSGEAVVNEVLETPLVLNSDTLSVFDHSIPFDPDPMVEDYPQVTGQQFEIGVAQTVLVEYLIKQRITIDNDHNKYDSARISISGPSSSDEIIIGLDNFDDILHSKYINLAPGTYNARIFTNCNNVFATMKFQYNAIVPNTTLNNGAGLRVQSIINHDKNSRQVSKRLYTYEVPSDGSSSGKLTNHKTKSFVNKTFIYNSQSAPTVCQYRKQEMQTVHSNAIAGVYSNNVFYTNVQEYELDSLNNNNGKTYYTFDFTADNFYDDKVPLESNQWRRGQLTGKIVFNADNDTILNEQHHYSTDDRVNSVRTGFMLISEGSVATICGACSEAVSLNDLYRPKEYYYTMGWKHLDSTITNQYFVETGDVTQQVSRYYYDNPAYTMSTRESVQTSDGNIREIEKTYPPDYTTNGAIQGTTDHEMAKGISGLVAANAISLPVEITTTVNDLLQEASLIEYTRYNTATLPTKLYTTESVEELAKGAVLNISVPDNIQEFNSANMWLEAGNYVFGKDNHYSDSAEATYTYNSAGLLENVAKKDGTQLSYHWGYNNAFPVIKGLNTEAAGLQTAIEQAVSGLNLQNVTTLEELLHEVASLETDVQKQETWHNFNKALRNNPLMADADIMSYTYSPLIGITSITDQANKVVYYEYDNNHSLLNIKDQDNNLVTTYRYNMVGGSELMVSDQTLALEPQGGIKLVVIESGRPWSLSYNGDWFTAAPQSGTGKSIITINAHADNYSWENRVGEIVITNGIESKTISLIQGSIPPYLDVPAENVNLDHTTASQVISLETYSTNNWQVTGVPSWLNVSPLSGTGSASINVSANTANISFNDLQAVLGISSAAALKNITITQQHLDPVECSGQLAETSGMLPVEGTQYHVTSSILLKNNRTSTQAYTMNFSFDGNAPNGITQNVGHDVTTTYADFVTLPATWIGDKYVQISGECGTRSVLVETPPYFDLSEPSNGFNLPATTEQGNTLSGLRCNATNSGQTSGEGVLTFMLSASTSGANPIVSVVKAFTLNSGSTTTITAPNMVVPSNITGNYYLVVKSNTGQTIYKSSRIEITAPPPPIDFTVSISYSKPSARHILTANVVNSNGNYSYTYQWTTADGNILSGASAQSMSCTASGTYNVKVTGSGGGSSVNRNSSYTISDGDPLPF